MGRGKSALPFRENKQTAEGKQRFAVFAFGIGFENAGAIIVLERAAFRLLQRIEVAFEL